jgi:hypothetical protein
MRYVTPTSICLKNRLRRGCPVIPMLVSAAAEGNRSFEIPDEREFHEASSSVRDLPPYLLPRPELAPGWVGRGSFASISVNTPRSCEAAPHQASQAIANILASAGRSPSSARPSSNSKCLGSNTIMEIRGPVLSGLPSRRCHRVRTRFRTIQVDPKDLSAARRQGEHA